MFPLPRDTVEDFVALVAARSLTIATVESCTAGALAYALSNVHGSGPILHGGFVVYSKPQKIALGVPEDLIARHTAVSMPVAKAMAQAAFAHSPADLALAITGVAGPDPDEDGNPVGLVCVAAARRGSTAHTREHRFGGGHDSICSSAMTAVLRLAGDVVMESDAVPIDAPGSRHRRQTVANT